MAGSPDKPQVRGGGSGSVVYTPASNQSFLSCCILLSLCSTFSSCLFCKSDTSAIGELLQPMVQILVARFALFPSGQ